jgi:hypothetical protein
VAAGAPRAEGVGTDIAAALAAAAAAAALIPASSSHHLGKVQTSGSRSPPCLIGIRSGQKENDDKPTKRRQVSPTMGRSLRLAHSRPIVKLAKELSDDAVLYMFSGLPFLNTARVLHGSGHAPRENADA